MSVFHLPKILRQLSLLVLPLVLLQSSCTVQKRLNEGSVWLKSYRLEGVPRAQARAMEKSLKPGLNRRALGLFPWRTHAYLGLRQGQTTRFRNTILTRFSEAPVLSTTEGLDSKTEFLRKALMDQGHLRASVRSERVLGKRGAVEVFSMEPGPTYLLGSIQTRCPSPELALVLESLQALNSDRFPRSGQPYQATSLNQTRNWLAQQLRDQGFFRFSTDFIEFIADSSRQTGVIDLVLQIRKPAQSYYHQAYRLNRWTLDIGRERAPMDRTFSTDFHDFPKNWLQYHNTYEPLDTFLALSPIDFNKDLTYSESKLRNTLNRYAQLGLFAPGNFELEVDDQTRLIGVRLHLQPLPKWLFGAETEFSTNSIALFGLNGNVSFTRRNALRLGDQLEIRASVGAESQQLTGSSSAGSGLNTLDLGLRTQLSVPGILRPGRFQSLGLNGSERTLWGLQYQRQQRLDFDRNILKASLSFTGQVHRYTRYELVPLEFTYANTGSLSADLQKLLDQLNDPLLRANFVSYFSSGLRGSWLQDRIREPQRDYWRLVLEGSGNLYSLLKGVGAIDGGGDTLFSLPYFRYLKADAEWRRHYQLRGASVLACRALASVGLPFGDQSTLPLEKRTFGGGTNSLRAWPVRGLGPGSLSNYASGRLIQFGEVRLESNLEWRFKLLGSLQGALFVDAGNIWTLNDSSYGGLGNFSLERVASQLAINQGTGLRYDFGFFVLRVDFALKVRDPALVPEERWVLRRWTDREWKDNEWRNQVLQGPISKGVYPLFSTVFGINYPF